MQQGWRGQTLCFIKVQFTFTKEAELRDSGTVSDNYQTFYIRFNFFPVSEGVFCQFSKTKILSTEPCPALVHVTEVCSHALAFTNYQKYWNIRFFLSLLYEHYIF